MKIERLTVDGFGHFYDRDFGPLDGRLTVFHGPNEAGKSTLLEFLRTMILGFDRNWRSTYAPLAGGRHGGTATIVSPSGERLLVTRHGAANGGEVHVVRESDGSSVAPAMLTGMLGGASRGMYQSVFAFSLDELQEFNTLQSDEVGQQIYSAGMGARRLPAALKALDDEQRKIFLKGGSKHEIAAIRERLREVDDGLERVAGDSERYRSLGARKAELDSELERLREERGILGRKQEHLKRIQGAWADWVEREQLKKALAETAERPAFPSDAVARLERLETELRSAERNLHLAEQRAAAAEEAATREVPDRALLELATEIEERRRNLGAFENSLRDLPKREAEADVAKAAFDAALKELGPGWDEERLRQTDTSLQARKAIEEWDSRLDEAAQALRDETGRVEAARSALRRATEDLAEATARWEALGTRPAALDAVSARQAALATARPRLDAYIRARERREAAEQQAAAGPAQRATSTPPWLIPAIAAVVTLIVGVVAGGAGVVAGIAGAAALGGLAAWQALRARNQPQAPASRGRDLRAEEAAALAAFQEAAQRAGVERPDGEALAAAETRNRELEELARRWAEAEAAVESAGRAEARARRDLEEQEAKAEAAQATLESRRREWERARMGRGIREDVSPSLAGTLLERVQGAAPLAKGWHDAEDRRDKIARDIADYQEKVVRLVERAGLGWAIASPERAAQAAAQLFARFEAARKAASDHEATLKAAEAARAEVEQRTREETEAREALAGLLDLAGAADAERLRAIADEVAERRAREKALEECESRLQRVSGPGSAYTALLHEMAGAEPDRLAEERAEVDQQLLEMEERQGALRDERTRAEVALAALVGEDEGSRLRAERETLLESLRVKAHEWARAKLAETLLLQARAKYEKERQPDVVKAAETYFRLMTEGRYERIQVPLGGESRTIQVWSGAAEPKEPKQLSRGTREQLYLALRFGLIEQFGKPGARLPVIVDDALVNFDPGRMAAAARAFVELSQRNQVIVFTCHPHLVEIFQEAYAGTQVIEIGNGGAGSPAPRLL